uniref:Secreted protein n=1 Tax=Candidatus Kentrum sp. TC TaxID=2126339 RepID=A0A450YE40_9GAMM|nr:MAG: hypothetical protein BECKTC1821D_GA0114238_10079 [Candidatus Kentron sp. TC]
MRRMIEGKRRRILAALFAIGFSVSGSAAADGNDPRQQAPVEPDLFGIEPEPVPETKTRMQILLEEQELWEESEKTVDEIVDWVNERYERENQ